MSELPRLGLSDLRGIVSDAGELGKGATLYSAGGLLHLSRYETRLSADAPGSGASPYKVQVDLAKLDRGRCSCPAARSRPYCKHAAALLVAWASQPEAFAVSTAAPRSTEARKTSVKRGKVDATALLAEGATQVLALVGELAVGGIASIGVDRADSVRALAEPLRANRLRRLSARVHELADRLDAAHKGAALDPIAWTDALSDMLLAARKIERHLAGQTMEDRYIEELIGRSWTKKDRVPVAGLKLVEVAHTTRVTPDDFRIVESRFIDVRTGQHFSEKQILPLFIARRTEAKRSWAGLVLDVSGGRYPGFAPTRLDIEEIRPSPLHTEALESLYDVALPSVGDALKALQEARKDVFAPDLLPVAMRTDAVLAGRPRLQLADAKGDALFLPDDRALKTRIAEALKGVRLTLAIGDVGIDGALPTFFPAAFVVMSGAALELRTLVGGDASSVRARRPRKTVAAPSRWVDVARAAGVSRPAVALGEAREELANAVMTGLAGFTPRTAAPIAARLTELGLQKPATLLLDAAGKPDPRDRLDDIVKIHQVTGIALVRLAGAVSVDRSVLVESPAWPSVRVPPPVERLPPQEISRRMGTGELDGFQAAQLADVWFSAASVGDLVLLDTWMNAFAAPWVVRQAHRAPEEVTRLAAQVLSSGNPRLFQIAHHTAIHALAAVNTPAARALLESAVRQPHNVVRTAWLATLGFRPKSGWGAAALAILRGSKAAIPTAEQAARATVLSGSTADERRDAADLLVKRGDIDAIGVLRAAAARDPVETVRNAAGQALAQLCDVDSVEVWLQALADREKEDAEARRAAWNLARIGEIRAAPMLLSAYGEAWHPNVALECLGMLGRPVLPALAEFLRLRPDLAKRVGLKGLQASLVEEPAKSG